MSTSCFGQSFINGDFEVNGESSCNWNMTNAAFTSSMANTTAFGTSSEVDIQQTGCGYAAAQNGLWFISLADQISGGKDAVSMMLSSSLIAGQNYHIQFYESADTTFASSLPPPFVLFSDSLEIGISNSATSFGTRIFASLPTIDVWTLRNIFFTASFPADYITIQLKGENYGWNFVDNFSIVLDTTSTILPTGVLGDDLFLPNMFTPNNDGINDVVDFALLNLVETYISVYNRWGNLVYKSTQYNRFWDGKTLDGKDCPEGVYYYTLQSTGVVNKDYYVKGFIQLLR